MSDHEKIFTNIYKNLEWGNNFETLYKGSSGFGSSLEVSRLYIEYLKIFIELNQIKSIVDLGCGDFRNGELIYKNFSDIEYTGYEIYEDLSKYLNKKYENEKKYTFEHLDIFSNRENIKNADLFILKDVCQHWSNEEIEDFLKYIIEKKDFKYLLLTNSNDAKQLTKKDIPTGQFRPISSKDYPINKFKFAIVLVSGRNGASKLANQEAWVGHILETSLLIK